MRRVVYCTILAAMWGGGMTLVVTYSLDFIDGAPRLSHLLVGGMLAAFSTFALAEGVAELLGIPMARAAIAESSYAVLTASIAFTGDRSRPSLPSLGEALAVSVAFGQLTGYECG